MAGEVKVETDQLKACSETYKKLAESFLSACNIIETRLEEDKNYWQGSFANDIDAKISEFKKINNEKIYQDIIALSNFLDEAVEKYIKWDTGSIPKDETYGSADYPDNVKASVHVKNSQELQDIYNKSKSKAENMTRNVDGSISCASLTKAKAEANGFNVDWSGNGNQVYGNIAAGEHSNYVATKYAGGNCLQDLINAEGNPITDIVISFPNEYGGGNKWGHVLYIDQIVDGKVYFSDNTSPAAGKVLSIDEFLTKYKKWNGTPIGCVHLKKK